MQRVVSLATLLHNLRAEKQSGHMSQVTVAQGVKRFNSSFTRVLHGLLNNWRHVCLLHAEVQD